MQLGVSDKRYFAQFFNEGRVAFHGMDIDPVCVKMANLNFSLW